MQGSRKSSAEEVVLPSDGAPAAEHGIELTRATVAAWQGILLVLAFALEPGPLAEDRGRLTLISQREVLSGAF